MSDNLWIILIGSLTSVACALVGCFLILRRLAMLGDAISHAVLPGIVLAFLITNSRSPLPMMAGAGVLGLFTAFMAGALARQGKLQEDASIGVTFTWLFAIGVILISRYASQVDLDQDCVLHGEIALAPFDTWSLCGMNMGPRAAWMTGGAALANLVFILLAYKQLKICAFDSALAASLGINAGLWHYLLMGMVSLTTVASFESVGAILVVAMLVVPANTAFLLTGRLWLMLVLASGAGVVSAVLGFALAWWLDGSIAGGMATGSGILFVLAAVVSPKCGIPMWLRRRRRSSGVPNPQY